MKRSLRGAQSGQLIIEAVLLLTLLVGMWAFFAKQAKEKKWFNQMVQGPWTATSGMIETGMWKRPEQGRPLHPNNFQRVISNKETP